MSTRNIREIRTNREYGYNYDDLARKYSVEEEKRVRRHEKTVKRTRKYQKGEAAARSRINSGIDFISAAMLLLAIGVIFVFAMNYLTLSSKIITMKKEVSSLKSQVSEAASANDEAYSTVDSSVDIGYVYDTAVGSLGMVYPSEGQVISYAPAEEGYVRQYSEVVQK